MTEAQLFEKVGRLQASLDELNQNYDQLLGTLAQVVVGEMDVGRVMVDLTNRGYSWGPPGASPVMPPTINGLPRIVVAPPLTEMPVQDEQGQVIIRGRNITVERVEKPSV